MNITTLFNEGVNSEALKKSRMKELKNIKMSGKVWLKQILCITRKEHYPRSEDKNQNDNMKMNIAKYIVLMQYTRYLSDKAEVELHMPAREVVNGLLTTHLSGLPVVNNEIAAEFDVLEVLRRVIEEEIISYQEDVNDRPDYAEAHFKLGLFHLLLRDKHSALEEYKILKDQFPSMADTLMRKWNIKTPF